MIKFVVKVSLLCVFLFCILIGCNSREQIETTIIQRQRQDADSLYTIGDSFYYKEQYREAVKFYVKASDTYMIFNDTLGTTKSLNDAGLSYRKLGIYDSARFYYEKALFYDSISKNSKTMIGRLQNIGITYSYEGNYVQSMNYYTRSLQLALPLNSDKKLASIYNSLGNVYKDIGKYKLAHEYYDESLKRYLKINNPRKLAIVYNNIGNTYMATGDYLKALEFHKSSLKNKKNLENKSDIAYSLTNIGICYMYLEEYSLSEINLKEAYQIRDKLDDNKGIAETSNVITSLYLKQDKKQLAEPYIDVVANYLNTFQNDKLVLFDALKNKADYYQRAGQFEQAYNTLENWAVLNDSLFNPQKIKVQEIWALNEIQLKEKEIQEEKILADQEKNTSRNRLRIMGLLILVLFTFFFFMVQLRKKNKKITALNKELDLLSLNILHNKNNDYQFMINKLKDSGFESVDAFSNMLFASSALDEALHDNPGQLVDIKYHLKGIIEKKCQALDMESKGVKVNTSEIASLQLQGKLVTRVTFIISELITNSVKHAIQAENSLTIKIILNVNEKCLLLRYIDNCEQVSKKQLEASKGMGWRIMTWFVDELEGNIEIKRENAHNIFEITMSLQELSIKK